jgi:RimJ/RimL family protein N-acetyltransferase
VPVEFRRVEIPHDHDQLVEFLGNDEWPFHARRLLTPGDVVAMDFSSPDVASFWIFDRRETVGLVRLLELGDIGEGAPRFDLRIATRHRGRGFGTRGTRWVVNHLFTDYPELHRIEANTRHDNTAMQRVLADAGFTHEGRLRETWPSDHGEWFDTMVYGILRADWTSTGEGQGALGASSD